MILIDTSAWVEYLRDAPGPVADSVDRALRSGTAATSDPVVLEVLAGARDATEVRALRGLLEPLRTFRCEAADFQLAAATYRATRAAGRQVRSQIGCLIAAVAIRADVPLLHRDRDFESIAAISSLTLA